MNPDDQKMPSGDFLGKIPRKKKPKAEGGSSLVASAPPSASSGTSTHQNMDNIVIPRKKKPKMLLHRAQEEERASALNSRVERASYPHPGGGSGSLHRNSSGGTNAFVGNSNDSPSRAHERKTSSSVPGSSNSGSSSKSGGRLMSENSRVRIVSDNPFIVRIKMKGVPFSPGTARVPPPGTLGRKSTSSGSGASVARSATNKRQRDNTVSYRELEDTDSDDFMTEEEEQELLRKRVKKKRKKLQKLGESSAETTVGELGVTEQVSLGTSTLAPVNPHVVQAPPPGVLSTLWYSRECFLHVFVMEKICGWKTRPKVQLVEEQLPESLAEEKSKDQDETKKPAASPLNQVEATRLQQRALTDADVLKDPKRRMEISRINPTHCPFVMGMAEASSQKQQAGAPEQKKRYKLQTLTSGVASSAAAAVSSEREEVLLVKWRGRSYMHCSWERASDIQRLDPSTSSTARNKIRRFYQNQEISFGSDWKNVLEEDRATAAAIHSHGISGITDNSASAVAAAEDEADLVEEHFSPQNLEIERILACDESEMNMEVLAKQRAINMRDEQEELNQKERRQNESQPGTTAVAKEKVYPPDNELPWDPEDNVRYVVKWKGLPYAEMSWEYWRDIKRDAVDEAEDFWYRQRAPSLEEARQIANRTHPHIRDFKKLQESPEYGQSRRPRPVAKLEGSDDYEIPAPSNESDSGFRLRGYQLEGVNWLLFNWWNRRSCILADEMGLGKTIQSAAFLQQLQTQQGAQVRGPFLIIAPLSLISQWQSELRAWAPDMNVILYHGSADARDFLVKQDFYYTDQFLPKATAVKFKKQHITKFHVLITTYEVVHKDIAVLTKIRWRALFVDEAHRLKNSKAKLFEELASIPRDYCVLLTGTPIANATEELWALLHFANPRTFSDKDKFLERFGEMTDSKQVNELHTLLKPYLLRRVKEDVEKSLPRKEETILEVSLTPIQKQYYKAIYERNTSFLFKGAKPNNTPSLMNVMMELRKCCNHPYLVKGAEDRILHEAAEKLKGEKDVNGNDVPVDYNALFGTQLVKSSGKMVLMEKLLQKLFSGGHKVLVFSQMVRVLDLLEELLKLKKYRYERLDGTTSSSSRLHAVERFKRKACQRFVMLLSTRAGGLGLNLTAADVVIIFDSDWNPQNDLQAMARAHRIGQTRAVRVYRLLTAKTYEMHMFHSASLKLGLERAVLSQNREQSEESDDNSKNTRKNERAAQAKEIDELLKKGAYDVFRDDDDKEAEKFMETDIDQLLEHSSKKVTYGATATSSIGSGLGSFSKASFVANTDSGEKDVDLDDPDFWSKAVGLEAPPEETPEDVAAMLDDGVKRSRKQVQVYDPYADVKMAEQIKKDRAALEKLLEKEEKERLKHEKSMKKQRAKEEKKRKLQVEQAKLDPPEKEKKSLQPKLAGHPKLEAKKTVKIPRLAREVRPAKRTKKSNRMRALRRAENEDPAIEQLKQAWEIPQRNRATAVALRFGFGRFCKLRSESNLSSLPLQDVEIFVRAYVFQLSLQVTSTLLLQIRDGLNSADIRALIGEWLGLRSPRELDWICDSIQSAMNFHFEVESGRRLLRMPMILAEDAFVTDLRTGGAIRALRRVCILARLNGFIEECLDSTLLALGHEELGKRGCGASDLASLDADLKSRFVTTEELSLAVATRIHTLDIQTPTSWWDRSCDVALIVGTFVHGLGNYDLMRRDSGLPFGDKISKITTEDIACKKAMLTFRSASFAVRQCFDDALEDARIKAELEVQAAVAAAAKAAMEREKAAALVRKGGAEAEVAAKSLPETQVEDAFVYDGTDTHFVTLPRMQQYIQDAARKEATLALGRKSVKVVAEPVTSQESSGGSTSFGRSKGQIQLSMPDARVLDYRLIRLLNGIEGGCGGSIDDIESNLDKWQKSDTVLSSLNRRAKALAIFRNDSSEIISEYAGIGLGGSQCGTSHRTLNDGSDFSFGSASSHLAQLAYGTDAPRFLRALGVPMNVTRFAISGLLFADSSCVAELLKTERLRYYGKEDDSEEKKVAMDEETTSNENGDCRAQLGDKPTKSQANGSCGKDDTDTSSSVAQPNLFGDSKESQSTLKVNSIDDAAAATTSSITDAGECQHVRSLEKSEDISGSISKTESASDSKTTSHNTPSASAEPNTQSDTQPATKEIPEKSVNERSSSGVVVDSESKSESKVTSKDKVAADVNGVGKKEMKAPPATPAKGFDPVELISDDFRNNPELRAAVCLAVIFYGFPPKSLESSSVNQDLWKTFLYEIKSTEQRAPEGLFDLHKFRERVIGFAPDVEVPDVATLQEYVESTLLPHCLRLCVGGNGPSTRNARGSHGDYETPFGISIYPEPSRPYPSPIPDPCLSVQEHSLEAVGFANALLRRVRLLRACVHLCSASTGVPVKTVSVVTRSKQMGQLHDLPTWWCPWMHDLALLWEAATNGLFSLIEKRSGHAVFAPHVLQQTLYAYVVDSEKDMPKARRTPAGHVAAWTKQQAEKFPSLNQLERRLGCLCSLATAEVQSEARFDNIPMFDHGGWPRN